jgi:inorganic triphosphatase YgiF
MKLLRKGRRSFLATEIEMKLSVPSEAVLNQVLEDPELSQYQKDDFEVRHMHSTYYDTADGLLNLRKWTLRLRDEGGNRIAAFKTANMSDDVGFFTRNEWQCAVDNIEDAIPMLIDLGAPRELKTLLKGRHLVPVCGAEFDRRAVTLYLDEGVRIEIAGDLGYLFAGEKKEPICELELELLYGDAASLPPLCSQLMAEYDVHEEKRSKYQRAKALADQE